MKALENLSMQVRPLGLATHRGKAPFILILSDTTHWNFICMKNPLEAGPQFLGKLSVKVYPPPEAYFYHGETKNLPTASQGEALDAQSPLRLAAR